MLDIPAATKESEKEAIPFVYNDERGEWGLRVDRRELPGYETDDFWEAMGMWKDWKMFGFPNAGGKDDQPCVLIDVIRLFESCSRKIGVV